MNPQSNLLTGLVFRWRHAIHLTGERNMAVKVLVSVDREAALQAVQALDALSTALLENEAHWPRKLKTKYKHARTTLVRAIGIRAFTAGIADEYAFE
jgi:hypothetical protein